MFKYNRVIWDKPDNDFLEITILKIIAISYYHIILLDNSLTLDESIISLENDIDIYSWLGDEEKTKVINRVQSEIINEMIDLMERENKYIGDPQTYQLRKTLYKKYQEIMSEINSIFNNGYDDLIRLYEHAYQTMKIPLNMKRWQETTEWFDIDEEARNECIKRVYERKECILKFQDEFIFLSDLVDENETSEDKLESIIKDTIKSKISEAQTTIDNNSLIEQCSSTLDIISPKKKKEFNDIMTHLINQGYFVILSGNDEKGNPITLPCIYEKNADELKLRKYLVGFAELLKNESIVDRANNGIIPTTKYNDAFGYSLDKINLKKFIKKNLYNQCTEDNLDKNKDLIDLWRSRINLHTNQNIKEL